MVELIEKLRAQFENLSSGQKKVAKLVFENPSMIAFTPAFEIGKQVGVSESTVIRLSQTLGFRGYAELQEMVQKQVKQGRTLTQHQEISQLSNEQPLFKELMKQDIQNIQRTMDTIEEKDMEQAVQLISEAKQIFVVGNLLSYGLAVFFSHWMNMVLRNTETLIPQNLESYGKFTEIGEDTLIIPILYPRYSKSTLEMVKFSKERKAKVLALTDSELSPAKALSDLMLISPVNNELRIDSYTAPMSLITSLMRSVTVKNHHKVEKHLTEIEDIYQQFDVFYQE